MSIEGQPNTILTVYSPFAWIQDTGTVTTGSFITFPTAQNAVITFPQSITTGGLSVLGSTNLNTSGVESTTIGHTGTLTTVNGNLHANTIDSTAVGKNLTIGATQVGGQISIGLLSTRTGDINIGNNMEGGALKLANNISATSTTSIQLGTSNRGINYIRGATMNICHDGGNVNMGVGGSTIHVLGTTNINTEGSAVTTIGNSTGTLVVNGAGIKTNTIDSTTTATLLSIGGKVGETARTANINIGVSGFTGALGAGRGINIGAGVNNPYSFILSGSSTLGFNRIFGNVVDINVEGYGTTNIGSAGFDTAVYGTLKTDTIVPIGGNLILNDTANITTIGSGGGAITIGSGSSVTTVNGSLRADSINSLTSANTLYIGNNNSLIFFGDSTNKEIYIGRFTTNNIWIGASSIDTGGTNYCVLGTIGISRSYLRGLIVNINDYGVGLTNIAQNGNDVNIGAVGVVSGGITYNSTTTVNGTLKTNKIESITSTTGNIIIGADQTSGGIEIGLFTGRTGDINIGNNMVSGIVKIASNGSGVSTTSIQAGTTNRGTHYYRGAIMNICDDGGAVNLGNGVGGIEIGTLGGNGGQVVVGKHTSTTYLRGTSINIGDNGGTLTIGNTTGTINIGITTIGLVVAGNPLSTSYLRGSTVNINDTYGQTNIGTGGGNMEIGSGVSPSQIVIGRSGTSYTYLRGSFVTIADSGEPVTIGTGSGITTINGTLKSNTIDSTTTATDLFIGGTARTANINIGTGSFNGTSISPVGINIGTSEIIALYSYIKLGSDSLATNTIRGFNVNINTNNSGTTNIGSVGYNTYLYGTLTVNGTLKANTIESTTTANQLLIGTTARTNDINIGTGGITGGVGAEKGINIMTGINNDSAFLACGSSTLGNLYLRGKNILINAEGYGNTNIGTVGIGTITMNRPITPGYTTAPTSGQIGFVVQGTIDPSVLTTVVLASYTIASVNVPSAGVWSVSWSFQYTADSNVTFNNIGYNIGGTNQPVSRLTSFSDYYATSSAHTFYASGAITPTFTLTWRGNGFTAGRVGNGYGYINAVRIA